MKSTGRLAGKVAIVTGAGQTPGQTMGNGRAIAIRFAEEGATVACIDRDEARAAETVAMIADSVGADHRAFAVAADVTDAADCERAVTTTTERCGRLDVLVNNVGIGSGRDRPAHLLDDDTLDLVLDVNLKSAVRMIRAALPTMREQQTGSIVNISSLASLAGARQLAYEMSKAAMNRLTTSVAQSQARHGIRCNAVLPGFIDTPMAVDGIAAATGRDRDDVRTERDAAVPLGRRMGTADDTANAALFLASDEARYITGVLLPVDGGLGLG